MGTVLLLSARKMKERRMVFELVRGRRHDRRRRPCSFAGTGADQMVWLANRLSRHLIRAISWRGDGGGRRIGFRQDDPAPTSVRPTRAFGRPCVLSHARWGHARPRLSWRSRASLLVSH